MYAGNSAQILFFTPLRHFYIYFKQILYTESIFFQIQPLPLKDFWTFGPEMVWMYYYFTLVTCLSCLKQIMKFVEPPK
jgi:hypothetical protein